MHRYRWGRYVTHLAGLIRHKDAVHELACKPEYDIQAYSMKRLLAKFRAHLNAIRASGADPRDYVCDVFGFTWSGEARRVLALARSKPLSALPEDMFVYRMEVGPRGGVRIADEVPPTYN